MNKGDEQTEGLDYFDTYSPITKINFLRMVLAIAVLRNLEVHQMDVKTTLRPSLVPVFGICSLRTVFENTCALYKLFLFLEFSVFCIFQNLKQMRIWKLFFENSFFKILVFSKNSSFYLNLVFSVFSVFFKTKKE